MLFAEREQNRDQQLYYLDLSNYSAFFQNKISLQSISAKK